MNSFVPFHYCLFINIGSVDAGSTRLPVRIQGLIADLLEEQVLFAINMIDAHLDIQYNMIFTHDILNNILEIFHLLP